VQAGRACVVPFGPRARMGNRVGLGAVLPRFGAQALAFAEGSMRL
jgi:hypothetical protein